MLNRYSSHQLWEVMAPILQARKLRLKEIRLKSPTSRQTLSGLGCMDFGTIRILCIISPSPKWSLRLRAWPPLLPAASPRHQKHRQQRQKRTNETAWKFCTSKERMDRMTGSLQRGRRRLQPRSWEQVSVRHSPVSPLLWLATKRMPRLVVEGQIGS